MGHYFVITDHNIVQGPLDFSRKEGSLRAVNLSLHNGVLQTDAPCQLILLSYDPALSVPYRIIMMSSDLYTYVEFEPETFQRVIMNGGLHQHNTYELVYIREGDLYQRIESELHLYPAGSFVILNRNVCHTEEYDTAFSTVSLSLSADYFKKLLSDDRNSSFPTGHVWGESTDLRTFLTEELLGDGNHGKNYLDFIPHAEESESKNSICDLFESMTRIMLAPGPGDGYFFQGYVCRLLNLLCQKDLFITRPIMLGTESESRIFSEITQLLEENNGRITREILVRKLRYSGSYLNQIVHTYTGMNITQYSLHFTLKRAAQLLTATDRTVSDIIVELGFSNRTYFYAEFQKQFGVSPRTYRLKHRDLR